MIKNKQELKEYMWADQCALGMEQKKMWTLICCRTEKDYILKYERLLRKTEYVKNCLVKKNIIYHLYFKWLTYCLLKSKIKLGFDIPPNVFGPGLAIVHTGTIIVSGYAKVGCNCMIQPMSNIGVKNRGEVKAANIGDNCYISMGAQIIGDVRIADNVTIGAGAVVVKNIDEPNTSWGGVPARELH